MPRNRRPHPPHAPRIDSFNFRPGRVIGGKYTIESKLGSGWEGEVYKIIERRTGVTRAAKVFYPQRNERDRAVTIYAKKLERLRKCDMVIQYHHSETMRFKNVPVTWLISEFVEGELLANFIRRQPQRRLRPFEALHLVHALARGLEEIHAAREYHGDLHDKNVLVRRKGVFYDLKLVDFYHWGRPTAEHFREDVVALVHLLYHAVGGRPRYPSQPPEIKEICLGLRRDLLYQKFPTARHLREHLESFEWARE